MLKKIVSVIFLFPALVFAASFSEGVDYQRVASAPLERTKTPMVMEFFSYGCPSCYKIEKPLNAWLALYQGKITFEKIPVVFKPEWELYAKAYYTANTLAMTNKISPALFKSIQDEKKSLNSPQEMIQFFVAQGLDKEIAKSAFEHSPSIDMQVKQGMNLMAHYQINGVPAFIINNKYKTDLRMAGSPERLFEMMNYLLKK